jgi:hypothetical protein
VFIVRAEGLGSQSSHEMLWEAWIERPSDPAFGADVAVEEDGLSLSGVSEVGGGFGGVDVIELLEHGAGRGGGGLEVVDLSGIGEEREAGGAGQSVDIDRWFGGGGGEVEVVAVAERGAGGFEFELAQRAVQGGAEADCVGGDIGMERALGAVEAAVAFASAFEPSEPVEVAAVGGWAAVAERVAVVIIPVEACGESELLEVGEALDTSGGGVATCECGQHECGEEADDGGDEDGFDQGEGACGVGMRGSGGEAGPAVRGAAGSVMGWVHGCGR